MNNQLATIETTIQTNKVDVTAANFGDFVSRLKEAQAQIDQIWKAIESEMQDRNITQLKGDWGTISFAERINWKISSDLDPYYLKATADTKKLNAAFAAGEMPQGADFTTTVYMTKRIK